MSSEVKANKISPATGTALQISDSGDTTTIPSGATLAIASGATIANSGTQTGFGLFSSYAIIADQKAQNTAGGTYTNGDWRTHDLQTEIADPDGIVSISSNQFTLAAGTYFIKWVMVLGAVIYAQSRLYNITDTAVAQLGMTGDGRAGENLSGAARVTIAGSKAFEIQLRGTNTVATTGFGFAANFGTEQYTTVEIFKEA
jgi:hypothetical protein